MLILILIIGTVLRLINLNQSLWLDEAAQAIESARPLIQQFDIKADFWPPLYHILLHFWMYFGRSEIWLRIPSIVFSLGTVLVLFFLAEEFVKPKWALFSAFLLSISQFGIFYAQEVRPYSLSAFLGMLTVYFLIKEKYISYVISVILFIYCTYLAPFMLIGEGVYILLFNKSWLKNWIIAMVIGIIAFLPWLPEFFTQLNIGRGVISALPGWSEAVSTPLYKSLPLVFIKFTIGRISFANKIIYAGVFSGLFLMTIYLSLKSFLKERNNFIKIGIFFIIPILLAFFVSIFLPVLAPQRMLYELPLFYLLVTFGLKSLVNNKQRWIIISPLLLINIYSVFVYWTNPEFQREQWRQAVDYIENNRTAASSAVFVFPDTFAPWQWYSRGIVKAYGIAPEFVLTDNNLINFNPAFQKSDRIYYFHYLTDLTDPTHKTETYLRQLGFIEAAKKDFPGVGFVSIYEKAMANL